MRKLRGLVSFIILGCLLICSNLKAATYPYNPPTPHDPNNGTVFYKGQQDIYLEVAGTDGATSIRYSVDNNKGMGSPEIGFNNGESPNYTGENGIRKNGEFFYISKEVQMKMPQNDYYWKAQLLDENDQPISAPSTAEKWFKLLDPPEQIECDIISISPEEQSFGYSANSGNVSLDLNKNDCGWTASSNVSWITVSSVNGTGDSAINYSIAENTSASSRSGNITIKLDGAYDTKTFAITQGERPQSYSYTWKNSSWSVCDTACGDGNKTRQVWCERNDGAEVDDGYCSGEKFNDTMTCFSPCDPTAVINSIGPNPANEGETVLFSGSGVDPDGGDPTAYKWVSNLNGELSDSLSFDKKDLKAGVHNISFCVTDNEGKTTCAQSSLTINSVGNVVPTIAITSHDDGQKVTSSSITLKGTASDSDGSISKVQVQFNDSAWSDLPGKTNWETDLTLKEGDNNISCRAFDDDGGVSEILSIVIKYVDPRKDQAVEINDEELLEGSIRKGEEHYYYIDVPDTAAAIVVKTEGGKANVANLYVNRNIIPTTGAYQAKSIRTSGDERIRIDSGPADGFDEKGSLAIFKDFHALQGRYYILVAAVGNGGDYSIRARYIELRYPFAGKWEITRDYGKASTHLGKWYYSLDFAQQGTCDDYGLPVLAPESGTVMTVYAVARNATTGFGRKVEIDLGDGYTTLQGHMASRCVRTGIHVRKGQEIGTLGNTGKCEGSGCVHKGAHQHFSLLKDGNTIAPEPMSCLAETRKKGFLSGQFITGDEATNPSTFMVIDDQNAEDQGAKNVAWEYGYNNKMAWSNGAGQNSAATSSMIWRPDIPNSGKYVVYAYIPDFYATAEATYSISHSSASNITTEEKITVKQIDYEDMWVRLSPQDGWYFSKGKNGYVELDNANMPTDKMVGFDAMMFTLPDWGPAGGEEPEIIDPNADVEDETEEPVPEVPVSILRNGSFESSNSPVEWEKEDLNCTGVLSMWVEPHGGHDGGKCLVVSNEKIQVNYWDAQIKQNSVEPLVNGEKMTITFWAKCNTSSYVIYVEVGRNELPYIIFSPTNYFRIGPEWREYKVTFVVANNPEESLVTKRKFCIHVGEGTGIIQFDDIRLFVGESPDSPVIVPPHDDSDSDSQDADSGSGSETGDAQTPGENPLNKGCFINSLRRLF